MFHRTTCIIPGIIIEIEHQETTNTATTKLENKSQTSYRYANTAVTDKKQPQAESRAGPPTMDSPFSHTLAFLNHTAVLWCFALSSYRVSKRTIHTTAV